MAWTKEDQKAYSRQYYLANKAKYIERAKKWAAANPDKIQEGRAKWAEKNAPRRKQLARAYAAKTYAANPEKYRARSREWHAKNPEAAKARMSKWRSENPDKMRDQHLRWVAKNPGRANALAKKYRKENPEKVVAFAANRRARKLASSGQLAEADVKAIVARQKGKCAACGEKTKLQMDHIMPLALGGSGRPSNFQGLCKSCNLRKHAKHPVDFNRSLGLLL